MGGPKKQKLTYIHHNPNPPGAMRELLLRWYAEGLIALEKEGAFQKVKEQESDGASA